MKHLGVKTSAELVQYASSMEYLESTASVPLVHQPTGLINVPGIAQGVAIDATDPHSSFCALEAQIETADVSMDSYGVIVSLQTRQTLRTTPSFPGRSLATWSENLGGQSSVEITDGRCFAGCWNNLTFCLWGRGVELLIDAVTMALTGQVKIYANLLADVGIS
jgi:hypothetical protein